MLMHIVTNLSAFEFQQKALHLPLKYATVMQNEVPFHSLSSQTLVKQI